MALSNIGSLCQMQGLSPDTTPATIIDALTELLDDADAGIKEYCGRDFEVATYPGAAPNGTGDSGIYSGTGTRYLTLRQYPIISVSAVYEDIGGYFGDATGAFAANTQLTDGSDFAVAWDGFNPDPANKVQWCRSGKLVRIGCNWPTVDISWPSARWGWAGAGPGTLAREPQQTTLGNIKVAYTAGFSKIPTDLREAANLWAWQTYRTRKFGGLNVMSEQLGKYQYTLEARPLIPMPGSVVQRLSRYREFVA